MLTGIPDNAVVANATNAAGWILPSSRTRNMALADLRSTLSGMDVPVNNSGKDRFWWCVNASPATQFSTKLTWEDLRPARAPLPWTKIVWYKGHIPKHAFTFWVAQLNRLPVRARTAAWGPNNPTVCCLCGLEAETRDHLFLHCSISSTIWRTVLNRFGRQTPFRDWIHMVDWLTSGPGPFSLTLKRLVTQVVVFYIWKERNSRLHNSTSSSPSTVFKQIDRSVRDSILARINRKKFRNLLSQWFTFES